MVNTSDLDNPQLPPPRTPYTFLFYKKPGSRPSSKGVLIIVHGFSSKRFLKVLSVDEKSFSDYFPSSFVQIPIYIVFFRFSIPSFDNQVLLANCVQMKNTAEGCKPFPQP